MSLGLLAYTPYRILQFSIILISAGFTTKCIYKFILVRREKNNPLNALKRLFWIFAILANGSSPICYLIGLSGEHVVKSKYRLIAEFVETAPSCLLLIMLITTLIIIEESVLMAIGKGSKGINWKNYLNFISIPIFIAFIRLQFVSFTLFTNVILDNKFYTRKDEFVNTRSLKAEYFSATYFIPFVGVSRSVGLIEGVAFLLVLSRLIPVLEMVYDLMKRSDKANRVKKAKLKEWTIFIVLCIFVALIRSIVSTISVIDQYGLFKKEKWVRNVPTDEDKAIIAENKGVEYFFLENYDIMRIVTTIIVGIASSFVAPCRKIKKG